MLFDTVWNAENILDHVIRVWSLTFYLVHPVNSILENAILFHLNERGILDIVLAEVALDLSHSKHALDDHVLSLKLLLVEFLPLFIGRILRNFAVN